MEHWTFELERWNIGHGTWRWNTGHWAWAWDLFAFWETVGVRDQIKHSWDFVDGFFIHSQIEDRLEEILVDSFDSFNRVFSGQFFEFHIKNSD